VVLKSIFFWDMTPEDGGDTFLRNVGYHSTHYTASYPEEDTLQEEIEFA
jgi:hypothetical protein